MTPLCNFFSEKTISDVCAFFSPGFDYNCLCRKSEYAKCPWGGRPTEKPVGFFVKPIEPILEAIAKGEF